MMSVAKLASNNASVKSLRRFVYVLGTSNKTVTCKSAPTGVSFVMVMWLAFTATKFTDCTKDAMNDA